MSRERRRPTSPAWAQGGRNHLNTYRTIGRFAGGRALAWVLAWPVMLVRAAIRRPAVAVGLVVAVALLLTIGPTGIAMLVILAVGGVGTWAWIDRAAFMRTFEKARAWWRDRRRQ